MEHNFSASVLESDGLVEICDVHFDLENLTLKVCLLDSNIDKQVRFSEVIGFRTLDELDLSIWWEKINLKNGWCFEVVNGGWKQLEETREDFISNGSANREYLVIGVDLCVSIIAKDEPIITQIQNS